MLDGSSRGGREVGRTIVMVVLRRGWGVKQIAYTGCVWYVVVVTTTTCRQLGNDTTYNTEKKPDITWCRRHVGGVGRTLREDTKTCHQNQLRTTSKNFQLSGGNDIINGEATGDEFGISVPQSDDGRDLMDGVWLNDIIIVLQSNDGHRTLAGRGRLIDDDGQDTNTRNVLVFEFEFTCSG